MSCIKNRNEFIPMMWVGFVSSRWNNEYIYLYIYNKTLVIMKWFHLTCCEKKHIHTYMLLFFLSTTSQMKSLHYDQCLLYFNIHIYMYINSLFHWDETKPTHIIGINSFLFFLCNSFTSIQAQTINIWSVIRKLINKSTYIYVCA